MTNANSPQASLLVDRIAARAAEVRERLPRDGASPARVAVTTGQQVGLFTGPLLTLVKARATIALAADLEAAGVAAEPCFWCAAEDHDLVEVTRVWIPGPDGPRDIGPPPEPLAANRFPVGSLPPGVDFQALAEQAAGAAGGPFSEEALFLASLARGKDFLSGFVASMTWLLGSAPLRWLDGADRADKPRLIPLALRLVTERTQVREILAGRAESLRREGRPLQVKSEFSALPLFALRAGERLLLREEAGRFSLKGGEGAPYTERDVVTFFESGEWLPSFSALTRPLAVSTLLPVAATVLGPAESAYWDQMMPLFDWAGLLPPVVVPRPTIALLDPAARRLLGRNRLSFEDLLGGPDAAIARRGSESRADLLRRIDDAADVSAKGLEALRAELASLEPGLIKNLELTIQNVRFTAAKLREKVSAAAGRSDETFARDVRRLSAELLPGGDLAERVFSPLVPLSRCGRDRLTAALAQLRWDDPGPQVIAI